MSILLEQQESVAASEESLLPAVEPLPSPHDPEADAGPTWDGIRHAIQTIAVQRGHYHGYPLPDDKCPLVVHPRFPLQSMNGFALDDDEEDDPNERPPGMDDTTFARLMALCHEFKEAKLVNSWYDERRQRDVAVFAKPNGRRFVQKFERGPGARLDLLLSCIGVSRVWDIDAEITAMGKLGTLIKPHQMNYYMHTGTFLESSKRSKVTYVFRRLRPTIAVSHATGNLLPLAALCMHPVGYYQGSFCGAMVPTDDVIAHLVCMRGDEHHFWKCCNQHSVWAPEAGI